MTYNTFLVKQHQWLCHVLTISIFFTVGDVLGQTDYKLSDFNSIRTPNAPAFSVLGIQPTSIERPNTPADLSISLDNATEGFTSFPKNYSIEFAPYWMSRKPLSLTWRKDTVRSIEESLERTFSVSLATTNKKMGDKEVRGLAYGFRAFLLSGRMSGKSKNKIVRLEQELAAYSKRYSKMGEELTTEFQKRHNAATTADEKLAIRSWYESEREQLAQLKIPMLEEEEKEANDETQNLAPQREGLIVELAYAGAYKNDTIKTDLKKSGYAFWITPAYVKDDYSLVGVYRHLKDSIGNKSTEYGFRFVYTKSRYAISLEYLKGTYQTSTTLPDRERLSMLVEYIVSKNLWIHLSFGEDNKNVEGTNRLFSTVGIKYNLSDRRYSF